MTNHILLEKAKRYDAKPDGIEMSDCIFNETSGYWVNTSTNTPMMSGDNPQKRVSKKCDIETGEDLKGE